MKSYSFYDGPVETFTTLTEDEILEQYWVYWYGKMCEKLGKAVVDKEYDKKDCIIDWCIIHWAWEKKR